MSEPGFSGTSGKIVGRVTDASTGEPLFGCNVIIEGSYLGAATNADGEYLILNVPPGDYRVKAGMIGYNT
ncbi:MAG: carboxypeptidase-like regulatory domain-containing protein, partial [Candidatus Marinimicrobia bacterium]|nr:carboxypeptidase-like regulatory domain-containing protein [Candidatus Neomarinimicrobiota bacterium]